SARCFKSGARKELMLCILVYSTAGRAFWGVHVCIYTSTPGNTYVPIASALDSSVLLDGCARTTYLLQRSDDVSISPWWRCPIISASVEGSLVTPPSSVLQQSVVRIPDVHREISMCVCVHTHVHACLCVYTTQFVETVLKKAWIS
ncbi:hypothetical protein J6590_086371, partial [Homalodisca vitripennis]